MNEYTARFKVLQRINDTDYSVACKRRSGVEDMLILRTNANLIVGKNYETKNAEMLAENYFDKEKSKIRIKTFIKSYDLQETSEPNNINIGTIDCYVCDVKQSRKTPFGKTITEFKVAYNESNGKSSYIHCIAFTRVKFKMGEKIRLFGKLQSRDYINSQGENGRVNEFVVIHISNLD